MERIKTRLRHLVKPRPNTDAMAEILDLIAPPLYVYTISYVVYFGYAYLIDYHYGNSKPEDTTAPLPRIWYFQKCFSLLIYIQMMANWIGIRFVNTSTNQNFTEGVRDRMKWNIDPILESNGFQKDKLKAETSENGTVNRKKSNTKLSEEAIETSKPIIKKQTYWSWKPCFYCRLNAPPRCHHCSFCETCILKRDHHCFFAGRCIGFHNQRHFVVFLMWASFGTTYAMIHFVPYLYNIVLLEITGWDCFLPVAMYKLVTGQLSLYYANLVISFTLNLFFIFLSTAFLLEQFQLISEGITQFEQTKVDKRKLHILDPRPFGPKVKAVLGSQPLFTIVFPLAHWFYLPCDDPFMWPYHKITHTKIKTK